MRAKERRALWNVKLLTLKGSASCEDEKEGTDVSTWDRVRYGTVETSAPHRYVRNDGEPVIWPVPHTLWGHTLGIKSQNQIKTRDAVTSRLTPTTSCLWGQVQVNGIGSDRMRPSRDLT